MELEFARVCLLPITTAPPLSFLNICLPFFQTSGPLGQQDQV